MVAHRFRSIFPEISKIDITVRRMGRGFVLHEDKKTALDPEGLLRNNAFACGNPLCRRGGYQSKLLHIIWEMNRNRRQSRHGTIRCPGVDRVHKTCPNRLRYRIRIAYENARQTS